MLYTRNSPEDTFMTKLSKTLRMLMLCTALLISTVLFAVGMGVGALHHNLWLLGFGAVGYVLSVLGLDKGVNMDVSADPVDGAQIILRNHHGLTRNIGAAMPLRDALQVAFAMSDGHAITRGIPSMFFVPAFRCPGGTLLLLRTGNYKQPLTTN
jgi:hypothetical protein